jgi:hypothetical protein
MYELYFRARQEDSQFLWAFTPLWGATFARDLFLQNENPKWQEEKVFSIQVNGVLDNQYADKSILDGLDAATRKRRVT